MVTMTEENKKRETDIFLTKGCKILVVDDEDLVRMLISDILAENGYEVYTLSVGDNAISKISEYNIDLLITDIKMPGINGIDLMCRAKKTYPYIDVIVITGYATLENEEYCMAHGAADYITKPFQFKRLLTSVDRIVGKRSQG